MDLGTYGLWRGAAVVDADFARTAERLGYGTVWIGGSPAGDLALAEELLAATERIVVATGIVNMWATKAEEVAPSYHRLAERFPDRFLLGVGIGHPEATQEYRSPMETMVDYLDALDRAGVPKEGRVLAALGPKALALAAERTRGTHPYLVPPQHTAAAREAVGPGVLVAPEQKVVLETDPERARAVGRPVVDQPYLHLTNYLSNLRRFGWSDADFADGGSDELIDVLSVHGDVATVAAGLTAHVDAGADHVCAQVLTAPGVDIVPVLTAIAEELHLA
ncbi:LLM class F420-dependent oxidoreductase [Kineococcus rubinsiae]|uniref:LLM class F420-dependent oxidoreductase n=1 Tax=Kineococcus rubinsiae TaxID=2609562 RepID=UPI001431EA28|nr:LLM class F420-dependent oxidoreductase [Kineococcus rubinsiae]NIZ91922.1 LLM class F420-dependent oxidoreductase [Kineococcus rubinsiae]